MVPVFVQQIRDQRDAAHAAFLSHHRACQRECATGGLCRLGWWLDAAAVSAAQRHELAVAAVRNAA